MFEYNIPIQPNCDQTSASYRQKMSWTIKKEDWMRDEEDRLYLQLKSVIPGTFKIIDLPAGWQEPYAGGLVCIYKQRFAFETDWPKDVNLDLIHINAEFKIKTIDGKLAVDIGGRTVRELVVEEDLDFQTVELSRLASINTDLLFDEDGSFIVEADLLVEMKQNEADNSALKNSKYCDEMKSIFNDEKNSNVIVIAADREFKCHKAILSARSEVFKNTLAHNTVERNTNTIVIKETSVQAVEDMLKFIYSGEVPEDPKSLTADLLHIANMHQLHPLVEACLKNLVDNLDVPSCISTFMLVDRYMPQDQNMREIVIKFMQCKAMEVVEQEDWIKLMEKKSDLAQELVRALARETKERHKCQFCLVSYN